MIGIIIVGHGNFASGMRSSIELIIGKQNQFYAIDFDGFISPNQLSKQLEMALEGLSNCKHSFIFTDLLGGTPFRQAATLTLKHSNISVFAGTNLPMLIECFITREKQDDIDHFAEQLVETGMNQLSKYQGISDKVETDLEDGI